MEQGEQVLAALGHVQVEADGLLDHVQAGFSLGLPVALELGQDILLEVAEDGEEDFLLVLEMIEDGPPAAPVMRDSSPMAVSL